MDIYHVYVLMIFLCLGFVDVGQLRAVVGGESHRAGHRQREERDREVSPPVFDFAAFIFERVEILFDRVTTSRYCEVPDRQLEACLEVPEGALAGTLALL